jgi:hypothetical protein
VEKQQCGETQLSIHPQKVQHMDQHLMKPGHIGKSVSRELHFIQIAVYCILNIRAAKKD